MGVAVAVQGILPGGHPGLFQPGAGGGDGFRLDVKAQHTALRCGKTAQKGRVAAVAAGGVHAQARVHQPRGEEVLHEFDGGQVRGAAAHQLRPLGRKADFGPEGHLGAVGGQGCRKHGGGFAVITAKAAQYFF